MSEQRPWIILRAIFTVICLLTVITLVLFPIFAKARVGGKDPCRSHMAQIAKSFVLYRGDNDDYYPSDDSTKKSIAGRPPMPALPDWLAPVPQGWLVSLRHYLPFQNQLRCRLDDSRAAEVSAFPNPYMGEFATSYTANGWSEYHLSQSSVENPQQWILLAERNNHANGAHGPWTFAWWTWQGTRSRSVWPPTASPEPTLAAAHDLSLDRHESWPGWMPADGHFHRGEMRTVWGAGDKNRFWPTTR